jgi:hypothetical protein
VAAGDAEADPVPAVIDCLPYRKRDGLKSRDEEMYPYFAGHGYAALRIDLRGTGDSEGLPDDEYTPAEQADLIARSPGSRADVVQRQGRDDGHLLGRLQFAPGRDAPAAGLEGDHHGLRLGRPLQRRCALHAGLPAARQFRLVVGDVCLRLAAARSRDRRRALARDVDGAPQALQVSGAHLVRPSARDEYWRQGSACENYDAIECAVFASAAGRTAIPTPSRAWSRS